MKKGIFKVNGKEKFKIEFNDAGLVWFMDIMKMLFDYNSIEDQEKRTIYFEGPKELCPPKPKSSPRK